MRGVLWPRQAGGQHVLAAPVMADLRCGSKAGQQGRRIAGNRLAQRREGSRGLLAEGIGVEAGIDPSAGSWQPGRVPQYLVRPRPVGGLRELMALSRSLL